MNVERTLREYGRFLRPLNEAVMPPWGRYRERWCSGLWAQSQVHWLDIPLGHQLLIRGD